MSLIKFGHRDQIKEGDRIPKDSYDRYVVLVKQQGKLVCYELPDTSYADCDVDKIPNIPGVRRHSVVEDIDGMIWVNLASQPPKPIVDKSFKPPSGDLSNITAADVPPPLLPFAGREAAPMPPSPAKPFSLPASPLKPSPFKERVDIATAAVVKKAKMGALFGAPKPKPVAAESVDV